jgi:hypothetical protein
MNGVAVVPANEFLQLGAVAVFRELTQAIPFHTHNLNELRRTRNLQVGNLGVPPRVAASSLSNHIQLLDFDACAQK